MLANADEERLHFFMVKTEPKRYFATSSDWFNYSRGNISCRNVTDNLQLSESKTILKTPAKNHPAAV